ncbi:hypothetical protein [Bacillus sp. UNC41MFS5]|uniref:hypothetical protein n=1 Tax=Bacillus sp. UNC41MFS5 TaxID=1449046 RepID=UPI0012DEF02F|nr:hypothetical protein [Bacillus sp. UNC41MFS5]
MSQDKGVTYPEKRNLPMVDCNMRMMSFLWLSTGRPIVTLSAIHGTMINLSGNTVYGTGQFEITHRTLQGIKIADMAFYYRTAIKELLFSKGLKATFMSAFGHFQLKRRTFT